LYGVVDLWVGASSAFESAFESSADNSTFEGQDGEGDAGHHNAGKEEEGKERGRRRRQGKERALRMPHLAARVEGVVCARWPPWDGEVGMEVCSLFSIAFWEEGTRGRTGYFSFTCGECSPWL
jgi:hypothetical protein